MKKVLITGATGLIGTKLAKALAGLDYSIYAPTRDVDKALREAPFVRKFISLSDYNENAREYVSGCDAVVNLAGAPISKKWTPEYKKLIVESRLGVTRVTAAAIKAAKEKPPVFVSASAVGYYGSDYDDDMKNESSPAGDDFLAEVCKRWEEAASDAQKATRTVFARIGVVLAREGGALPKMTLPFKLFAGGPVGDGSQQVSWIHIDDLVELLILFIENKRASGAANCVAPNPVDMDEFAKVIGKTMKRPAFFRAPEFAVRALMGEAADIVLKGQRAIPEAAMKLGYKFKYPVLREALENLLK